MAPGEEGRNLRQHCAKIWDLCVNIIKDKAFWVLAAKHDIAFIHYLTAFKAMRGGRLGRFPTDQ